MDIGSLTGQISLEDQLSGALSLMTAKVETFVESFNGAFRDAAIAAGVATTAIAAVTTAVTALGVHGAEVNDVTSTFDHFADAAGGADRVLDVLRSGTKETIDDFVLMRDASRLMSAGVKLNAEDFNTLSSAAFVLQNRGLGTTAEMLDLVSSAMITGRTRALAMKLGVVDAADAEQAYADKLGVAKSELTETQVVEAKRATVLDMLRKAVSDAGNQERDFGENIERVRAKFSNWLDDLSSAVAKSPSVTRALTTVSDALLGVGDKASTIDGVKSAIDRFADAVTSAVPKVQAFGRGIGTVTGFLYDHRTAIGDVIDVALAFGAAWLAWGIGGAIVTGVVGGLTAVTVAVRTLVLAATANPIIALTTAVGAAALAFSQWIETSANAKLKAQEQGAVQDALNASLARAKPITDDDAAATRAAADAATAAKAAKDSYNKAVQAVVDSVRQANREVNVSTDAFNKVTGAMKYTVETQQVMIPLLDKIIASNRTLTRAEQEYYDVVTVGRINLVHQQEALLEVHKVRLDEIQALRAQGYSEQELAAHFGASINALKAYETEMTSLRDLRRQVSDFELQSSGHALDLAKQQHLEEYQDAVDKLDKTSAHYAEFVDQLARLRQMKDEAEGSSWADLEKKSISALEAAAQAAERDYNRMVLSGDFFRKDIDAQKEKVDQLWAAVRNGGDTGKAAIESVVDAVQVLDHAWVTDADVAATALTKTTTMVKTLSGEVVSLAEAQKRQSAGASADVTSANFQKALMDWLTYGGMNPGGSGRQEYRNPYDLAKAGYSFSEILKLAYDPNYQGALPPPQGPRIPGFAEGGLVEVGEKGPERVALPYGSIVYPNGGMPSDAGTNVTNHFYVNGTADDVARTIMEKIMTTLKTRRQFPSA